MKSRIVIILFFLVSAYIISNTARDWDGWVFKYDKSGYHLHLPAAIIYKDITKLEFYSYIDDVYQPSGKERNYCIDTLDNGNRINRYNIGVAVHELPFFLAAHFINTYFPDYAADGYSTPYQWGAIISNLVWVVLGLFVLRRFLLRYFSDNITALTLLAIAFGTNLYYYVVFHAGMAHAYSFCHFALIMLFTGSLYKTGNSKYFYLLAITLGLIGITRSSNLPVALIPLLWGVHNTATVKSRLQFFKANIKHIVAGFILFIAVMMLQMGYWKYITGQWLYDGYADEGFVWTEPRIWKGLFGFQKGWFIYTPIAIFAVWGIYSMRKRFSQHIPAIAIFMVINIYVIFSWWNWWYGGGFSCRPLIETMAVLSLPLAAFIQQVATGKYTMVKYTTGMLLILLVALNMFQSFQCKNNTLHWERTTWKYYSRVFLKYNATEEDMQYLMPEKEIYGEMEHRMKAVRAKKK